MANYAYLRVSTHTQDVENQKLSVLDYCNSQGIAPIEFVEDTHQRSEVLERPGDRATARDGPMRVTCWSQPRSLV